MTQGIKKIDWLRQLYHEVTKWSNGLTGQVKWSEMKEKDPNNGSKMTVKSLEEALPTKLKNCMMSNSVPAPYIPEVIYFLATVGQKIDNVTFNNLVSERKQVLNLMESLEQFSCLTEDDKAEVVGRVDVHSLYTNMTPLLTCLVEMGVVEGQCDIRVHTADKKFKQIDWLRHIYLMCRKWLSNTAGQMQWKGTQDPNNSKDGNRMKMEELKESLKVLVAGLQDEVIPLAYRSEIDIIRKVLCQNEGSFRNPLLAAEEHLRKVALKLEETFSNLTDPQHLVSALDVEKLPWVLFTLTCLKNHLWVPDGGQEVDVIANLEQEIADDVEVIPDPSADDHVDEISLEPKSEMELNQTLELNGDVLENDGTEYLDKIIDEAFQQEMECNKATVEIEVETVLSAEREIYPDSPLMSPISDHRPSTEDPFSDDSGFYSPESDCSLDLDQEDTDELMKYVDGNEEIMKDLDFEDLPDLTNYIPEFTCNRKRRLSCESSMEPVMKKAKP